MIWNLRPVMLALLLVAAVFVVAEGAASLRMSLNWDCVAAWMRRLARVVSSFGIFKSHCLDVGYQVAE